MIKSCFLKNSFNLIRMPRWCSGLATLMFNELEYSPVDKSRQAMTRVQIPAEASRARSSVWLEHRPFKPGVAGSKEVESPVGPIFPW